MGSIYRASAAILGLALLWVGQATAQPLIDTVESLESLVINADRVWVGRIVGVRDKPIPGGSKLPGITIAIEETLKLPLFEQGFDKIGLFVEHPTARFKTFAERKSRLLIVHSDHNQFSPKLIDLTPGKAELFTADFTILHKPDAILQTAREIIRRAPAYVRQLHTFRLTIPRDVLARSNLGAYGQLIVPVDEQLETRAIEFLKSKSDVKRSEAAKILRYFKSDANIDRLRTLLKDSGYSQQMTEGQAGEKYYGVRDQAYQTLKAWGIEVERPVITEPDSQHDE